MRVAHHGIGKQARSVLILHHAFEAVADLLFISPVGTFGFAVAEFVPRNAEGVFFVEGVRSEFGQIVPWMDKTVADHSV